MPDSKAQERQWLGQFYQEAVPNGTLRPKALCAESWCYQRSSFSREENMNERGNPNRRPCERFWGLVSPS